MKRILLTGDSITDAGRNREDFEGNGRGYPHLIDARMDYEFPGEYQIINRGISGNRIVDLYSRIKCDCINLKPDYISILIGVNDVWHEIGGQNGVEAEKFEKIYRMFLEEVKTALPDVKIMILTPYVTAGTATDEHLDEFKPEVDKRRTIAISLAKEFDLPFIDLQEKFNEAEKKAPASHWTTDGVHPTPAGHELIARAWMDGFNKMK